MLAISIIMHAQNCIASLTTFHLEKLNTDLLCNAVPFIERTFFTLFTRGGKDYFYKKLYIVARSLFLYYWLTCHSPRRNVVR